jgi:hypothetical protein
MAFFSFTKLKNKEAEQFLSGWGRGRRCRKDVGG